MRTSRISGSTLIEVVASLGLLSLLFALSMMVVGNLSSASQLEWMRIRTWTRTMLNEPTEALTSPESIQIIGPYRLEKTVESVGNGLRLITVRCYEKDELMYQQQRWSALD